MSRPRKTSPTRRAIRQPLLALEQLEDRSVPSTIVWTNRGQPSDNFAVLGANANLARACVDRAIADWEAIIGNFNDAGGSNTYTLSIDIADLGPGGRGATGINNVDASGKPTDASITLDDDGGGTGWYFDPVPSDDAEFTQLLGPFAANGPNSLNGADFYRTSLHEIGHAMGLALGNGLAFNNFVTNTGTADPNNTAATLFLFTGPSISATFTDEGGGHTYEGPAVGNLPIEPNDLMNGGRTSTFPPCVRRLISDTDALILRDAYSYTINLPSTYNTFYANLNRTTGVLTVSREPGPFNDSIVIEGLGTTVRVHFNNTVETIPSAFITSINVQPGDGNDTLTLDYSNGALPPVTFTGGLGTDALQIVGPVFPSFTATGTNTGVLAIPGSGNVTIAAGVEQLNAFLPGGGFTFNGTNNANTFTIAPSAIAGAPAVGISSSVSSLPINVGIAAVVTVDGLGGADTFNVIAGGLPLPVSIVGGPPTTAPGDVLNVNFAGAPRATLIVTGPDSGIYVFPGHPSITFSGIETNLTPQVRTRGPQATVAVGVDSGAPPIVQVVDGESGQQLFRIPAYPLGFVGGVRVAVGDVNGDLIPDIITAPGRGIAPLIKVFDGRTGGLIRAFLAYPSSMTTGVNVAAGDVNADGVADIITAPDRGAMPLVEVFDGRSGTLIRAFIGFTPGFRGGLHVAAGLVNGDKFAEIIVAASSGPPIVETFDGRTGAVAGAFLAYAPTLRSGVWVTTGDVNADGLDDIITGPSGPAPPLVRVFDASGNSLLTFRAFQTFQPAGISDGLVMSGGARVGAVDVNRDGVPEIIIAQGPGSPALLVEYSNVPLSLVGIVQVFSAGFGRGLTIGASA